jgi:hypothetical protein
MLAAPMQVTGRRTAAVLAALTLSLCVVAFAVREPSRDAPPPPPVEQVREEPPEESAPQVEELPPPELEEIPEEPQEDSGPPGWLLPLLIALAVAAALLTARGLLRGRGARRAAAGAAPEEPEPDPGADAAAAAGVEPARRAVEAALDSLSRPLDARRAVIEAYARMEEELAQRALGRRAPEAPREYLERVLHERGMPAQSLTVLTDLFEEARFSTHPIPESAPARAADELEQARAALAVH